MNPAYYDEETLGKFYDLRLLRGLWKYLKRHKPLLALSVGLGLPRFVLEALPALVFAAGVNRLAPTVTTESSDRLRRLTEWFMPPESLAVADALLWLCGVMLALQLVWGGVEFARMMSMMALGQRSLRFLRRELFDHVQRLPMSFFDRYPVGRLVTRLTNDVENLGEMFSSGLIALVLDLAYMVFFAVLLFSIDARLALVSMAIVPLLAVIAPVFRWKMRTAFREARVKIARLNALLQETISGMKVVQLFTREARNHRDFDVVNREHRDAWFRSITYDGLLSASIELAQSLTVAAILWYGAYLMERETNFGVLLVFIDYMRRFFRPLTDLAARYSVMQSSMASLERIFELLERPAEPADVPGGRVPARRGEVEFDRVTFSYGDEPVLHEVSFRVAPGEHVALVGPTGSGKTTILKLLARLYEIEHGSIRVDGVDIRELPRRELRRRLAFVLQDVFLFTGDLAYNIGLGRVSEDGIREAARTAHVDALVRRLPDGYAQQVKERGVNFSGGERQLLSFARGLAQQPDILLLDEATSSVDTETEALVQDALHRLLEGKTSIVVAHRLSTIRDADRIYVMHHGAIRESGSHEELLAARGLYWRLYQLQYAQQEAA